MRAVKNSEKGSIREILKLDCGLIIMRMVIC